MKRHTSFEVIERTRRTAAADVADEHEDEEGEEDEGRVEVVRQEGRAEAANQRVGQARDDRDDEPQWVI